MGFRLANIDGRAALVCGENYYDLENLSGGELGSDPMAALGFLTALSELGAQLTDKIPTGKLSDVELGPPVPRPDNCYAIGLNYRSHAEEAKMTIPDVPMVFSKHKQISMVMQISPVRYPAMYASKILIMMGQSMMRIER